MMRGVYMSTLLDNPYVTTDEPEVKLAPIFNAYLTRLMLRGTKQQGLKNFLRAAVQFTAWCDEGGIDPLAVGAIDLFNYFEQAHGPNGEPYADGTKRLHYVQLRGAYTYARDLGTEGLPARAWYADFVVKGKADSVPEVIPSAVLGDLLRNAPTARHHALLVMLAFTGMRMDEIRRARWEDIDYQTHCLHVIGKGGKARVVPIHPKLAEVLYTLRDSHGFTDERRNGPIIYTTTSNRDHRHFASPSAFERFLTAAGSPYSFHYYRRTVGSSLSANEVEESIIFKMLGWSARTVFARHYQNVSPAQLHKAIQKLYLDAPLGI